jgi:hypothetical protein
LGLNFKKLKDGQVKVHEALDVKELDGVLEEWQETFEFF